MFGNAILREQIWDELNLDLENALLYGYMPLRNCPRTLHTLILGARAALDALPEPGPLRATLLEAAALKKAR